MLDFRQTSNQTQTCRKPKPKSPSYLPSCSLSSISRITEPPMGFKPTKSKPADGETSKRSGPAHMPNKPTNGTSSGAQLQPTCSSNVLRTLYFQYPNGNARTVIEFSLPGRHRSPHKSPARLPLRKVSWTETTSKRSGVTKIFKPRTVRYNGKTYPVNETNATNVVLHPIRRKGRHVKSSRFAILFAASVFALGSCLSYTVSQLHSEIHRLRNDNQHHEMTNDQLRGALDEVQRVLSVELVEHNSTMSVIVAISNVLSWAVGG